MPTSFMAQTANGLIPAGRMPALSTRTHFAPWRRAKPSAIWLRAELPVHTKSTEDIFIIAAFAGPAPLTGREYAPWGLSDNPRKRTRDSGLGVPVLQCGRSRKF